LHANDSLETNTDKYYYYYGSVINAVSTSAIAAELACLSIAYRFDYLGIKNIQSFNVSSGMEDGSRQLEGLIGCIVFQRGPTTAGVLWCMATLRNTYKPSRQTYIEIPLAQQDRQLKPCGSFYQDQIARHHGTDTVNTPRITSYPWRIHVHCENRIMKRVEVINNSWLRLGAKAEYKKYTSIFGEKSYDVTRPCSDRIGMFCQLKTFRNA